MQDDRLRARPHRPDHPTACFGWSAIRPGPFGRGSVASPEQPQLHLWPRAPRVPPVGNACGPIVAGLAERPRQRDAGTPRGPCRWRHLRRAQQRLFGQPHGVLDPTRRTTGNVRPANTLPVSHGSSRCSRIGTSRQTRSSRPARSSRSIRPTSSSTATISSTTSLTSSASRPSTRPAERRCPSGRICPRVLRAAGLSQVPPVHRGSLDLAFSRYWRGRCDIRGSRGHEQV